ncbi:MAG: GxxExxY protein [Candidatus Brennerbacteria bacterium]|nr:GxxExxY protein [Candidatus Brennerbacteria bacterium]
MNANNANAANNKVVYPRISYELTGISFKVQNGLGRFCTEKQYASAFEKELKRKGIKYEREHYVTTNFEGEAVGKNWIDFLVNCEEGWIIVDLKAKPFIERKDYYQTQRYLELKNIKLGLIINFQNKYLRPKRVLNSRYSQDS